MVRVIYCDEEVPPIPCSECAPGTTPKNWAITFNFNLFTPQPQYSNQLNPCTDCQNITDTTWIVPQTSACGWSLTVQDECCGMTFQISIGGGTWSLTWQIHDDCGVVGFCDRPGGAENYYQVGIGWAKAAVAAPPYDCRAEYSGNIETDPLRFWDIPYSQCGPLPVPMCSGHVDNNNLPDLPVSITVSPVG